MTSATLFLHVTSAAGLSHVFARNPLWWHTFHRIKIARLNHSKIKCYDYSNEISPKFSLDDFMLCLRHEQHCLIKVKNLKHLSANSKRKSF